MPMLRILTFNWHDPYLYMFSRVGHRIEVGDWMLRADGTRGWDLQKRPLPEGLTLIGDAQEAVASLKDGRYDLAVCHTFQDLSFVAPFDVPTVFLSHNALHNDGMNDPAQMTRMRREVEGFLTQRHGIFVAISPMKLESWGLDGFVVRPGVDLEDYGGYTGEDPVALSVGNLFVERDHMLGYRYLREIVEGLPHRIVGENPRLPEARKAEDWEDLKGIYRRCRVYVNTTVEAFEDGYNLGMLEAMATGMPVVCLGNKTSPIRDGENGYTSGDVARLRERVEALLEDPDLACRLGEQGRRSVAEQFSTDAFVARWQEIFEACLARHGRSDANASSRAAMADAAAAVDRPDTDSEAQDVSLRYGRDDIFPYSWDDVVAFLDVEDARQIAVPRLKLERQGNSFLCDVFLYNRETGQQMVWQGVEAYAAQGDAPSVVWPPYVRRLDDRTREALERAISGSAAEVGRRGLTQRVIDVNLDEIEGFVHRVGDERVTPGVVRSDIFLHHAKRYVFARQFCRAKRVVDIGGGVGYGAKMLCRDAKRVVGLDVSAEAVRYAARVYKAENCGRFVCDGRAVGLRSGTFDVAVCFEMIEHVLEHETLLNEVRRLLRADGTFVVSTPNKRIYGSPENANPYHVGMLELDEFQALLQRHFGKVRVYGQMRPRPGDDYYRMFDLRARPQDDDEVYVAVCTHPHKEALPEASAAKPLAAPAVHARPAGEGKRGRALKVLFGHLSNPITAGRCYVDALRRAHDVVTCGPVIEERELAEWRKAEGEHALKPAGAGDAEKLGLIARLARPCDIPLPGGEVDIRRALDRLPDGWRPDLFVWFDSATGFLPGGLAALDCPTVCLVGDTHTGQMDWRIRYARTFAHVFLMYTRHHIPAFQAAGCPRVDWLPAACDPAMHGRIPAEKAYDVGFVGQTHRQWHPHRVRLLERLIQAGFDVHVESKILEEMALFHSRSRIVFNRSLNGDVNRRVFEALCSGSMLVTDRLPPESGLEDLFQDRKHLVFYDDEDLETLVRHYLTHGAERETIAAQGCEEVLAKHTYAHRADQMMASVFGAEADGIARCAEAGRDQVAPMVRGSGEPERRGEAAERQGGQGSTGKSGEWGTGEMEDREPGEEESVQRLLRNWKGPVRLNLGCGEDRREGYINIDEYVSSADLRMDIFHLDFEDGTVDEVFSSHMLEHLGKYEAPKALAEWLRVLRPSGMLQMNLPDLEWTLQQWLNTPESHRWGWALDAIYGLQTHPGEHHKTGFNAARMTQLLTEAGFARVRVSWIWSHGLRCLWVEAVRPEAGELPGVAQAVDLARFESQFPVEMSALVPYTSADCTGVFATDDWRVGLVSLERLPMDAADYTISVAVKQGERQMVLQGLRLFQARQKPFLAFPEYLKELPETAQRRLGEAVGQALRKTQEDPAYKDGTFVIAKFGADGDLGLEKTGERVIPGLTDFSLYIPHVKRYLLAARFAEGARVLDAGCGTGYGTKILARAAEHVDAVDISPEAIAFARQTYPDARIAWQVGDLRSLDAAPEVYDLVTSFEVIEHLEQADAPAYLDGLRRALKPGGVALISTPNREVAEQWENPHHHFEMDLEEFRQTVEAVFPDATILGQRPWSPQTEAPGQCVISGRVAADDDMYIAVCRKRAVNQAPEKKAAPRVSLVIPLYNKVAYTEACLKGLEAAGAGMPYEVILVDNGSTDGTGELLDRMAGRARVIRNGENLGFSRGNNAGAAISQGEYLLFLNNDTVPHPGWLDALVREAETDAQIGIVGAKLLYPDTGRVQHAGIELIDGVPDHAHRHAEADDPEVDRARDLDMVTGACMLIRRDVFERLEGFDEGYLNGVEDVDLCLRARDLGYRVRYCPAAVLDHHEGASAGRYDHVQPNLERFVKRWNGRFNAAGRFVPAGGGTGAAQKTTLRGCWEGTQFVYHSLSLVNMGLTSELIRSGACELKLIPYEPATFGPDADPERYGPIAERMEAELSGPAQFHVRHKWPPDFSPPPAGHWVMIQPWEFGRIPSAWVGPIQEMVDEVWTPSRYARQCYVDSGIDADRVHVVPNGVRAELFGPDASPIALDTEKPFKFLFVGGAIYRKGIDILLKTYRQTFSRRDDVCLVIKGMGEETFYKGQTSAESIRKMQTDPEAPEILYLTDDLTDEQMAGLYTACDCLLHPYRGEGFGMPVAEAMACGLPAVVTQGGACDDFCTEDRAYFVPATRRAVKMQYETAGEAWLLEPNATALAEQMRAVVAHPEAAREKGRRACAYVHAHLTWAHAAERALERLRTLLERPVKRTSNDKGQTPEGEGPTGVDVAVLPGVGDVDREAFEAALTGFTAAGFRRVQMDAQALEDEGTAAALNRRLEEMAGAYLVLLREDVVVTPGWLTRLLGHLEGHPEIAMIVPCVPAGPDAQRVRPRYRSTKKELQKFARRLYQREPGHLEDLAWPGEACAVVRMEVVRALGGFDGGFRTGAYLADFARRCRQQGRRVVCAHDTFVHCADGGDAGMQEAREQKAVAALETGDRRRAEGEAEKAIACYREALEARPDYLEALLVLSASLLEENRPEEAIGPLRELAERHPESSRVQNYLGRCLYQNGETEAARACFETAVTLDSEFSEAYSNLGVLLWETGELDAALERLNRAAELAPNDPNVIYNIGMVYAQLGQAQEATQMLRHYLNARPDDLNARVYLSVLLLENGAEDEGVTELERVLAEDPEHPEALKVVAQLQDAVDGAAQEGSEDA